MNGGLKVDLNAFGELVDTLAHAADALKQASGALKNVSAQDLGAHSLDSAAARFQERWGYGIAKIADASNTMVDGLKRTRTTYAEAEQSNNSFLKSYEAGLTSAPAAPTPAPPSGVLKMGVGQ